MSYPILHVIERIVAPLGLRIDESSPYVDARLPDGSRVHTQFSRTPIRPNERAAERICPTILVDRRATVVRVLLAQVATGNQVAREGGSLMRARMLTGGALLGLLVALFTPTAA